MISFMIKAKALLNRFTFPGSAMNGFLLPVLIQRYGIASPPALGQNHIFQWIRVLYLTLDNCAHKRQTISTLYIFCLNKKMMPPRDGIIY
jgi:hypothetical protein